MLEHALRLAIERKWAVFPCCAWDAPRNAPEQRRGKEPLIEHGFKGATREEAQIRRWWQQWPSANIGVACGASGIVVLDIDGVEGWRQIEFGGYELPETLVSRTGKPQGKHYIYKAGQHGIRNATKIFGGDGGGVDIRGDGGYIIVPPSKHYSGKLYEFEDETVAIAEPPLWMLGLHRQHGGRLASARKLVLRPGERITEGERNDKLYDLGCVFRRDNMIQDPELMFGLLQSENMRRCEPPLAVDEVRRIAASAVKLLPDEIELPPPGWGTAVVNYAKATGDPGVVKRMESMRAEIEAKLPEPDAGRMVVDLTRYRSDGVEGGTFSATISFRGREVTIGGLTGIDLTNCRAVKAKCLEEKLVIPEIRQRQWDSLMNEAMSRCVDVDISPEASTQGACMEAIREFVVEKQSTEDVTRFPAGRDRLRLDHNDGSYSVHAGALRSYVRRAVPDSRRKDTTAALKAMHALTYVTSNSVRMVRITT